jgi:hypothetical protein
MPKVIYTPAKGLVQQPGAGIQLQTTPYVTVQTQNVSSGTITQPGVYTISSSIAAGPLSTIMPLASAVPGGVFVFRNLSADANFLTGSAEAAGTKVFRSNADAGLTRGSKLALTTGIGNSVTLVSDGVNFCVLANSGALSFSN